MLMLSPHSWVLQIEESKVPEDAAPGARPDVCIIRHSVFSFSADRLIR